MKSTIESLKAEIAVLTIENVALKDMCKEYEKLLTWLEKQENLAQQYSYDAFMAEILDTNVDDQELMEMIAGERYDD